MAQLFYFLLVFPRIKQSPVEPFCNAIVKRCFWF
jgi:hypothetical protein